MKALNWKKLLPHLTAVTVFVLISLVYFSPVIEGKKLEQQDIRQFKGMSSFSTFFENNKIIGFL